MLVTKVVVAVLLFLDRIYINKTSLKQNKKLQKSQNLDKVDDPWQKGASTIIDYNLHIFCDKKMPKKVDDRGRCMILLSPTPISYQKNSK